MKRTGGDMKKTLIMTGVMSIALGLFSGASVPVGDGEPLWEKIPDEEIQTNIEQERKTKDMEFVKPVQEVTIGECTKESPQAAGTIELTYDDAQLLMKIAEAEAGNQGTEGMWLVMSVVLNRAESPDFPATIKEVIYQEHQFSSVSDGNFDNVAILSADAHNALAKIESGNVAEEIIGFEVKTSRELDKYFLEAFEYKDHRFYTEDFTKGD